MREKAMGLEFIMRKSDGVRVQNKGERWGESSPLQRDRWGKS